MSKSGRNGTVITKIRNVNVGEMATDVSPTVEALNKKKGGKKKHCVNG